MKKVVTLCISCDRLIWKLVFSVFHHTTKGSDRAKALGIHFKHNGGSYLWDTVSKYKTSWPIALYLRFFSVTFYQVHDRKATEALKRCFYQEYNWYQIIIEPHLCHRLWNNSLKQVHKLDKIQVNRPHKWSRCLMDWMNVIFCCLYLHTSTVVLLPANVGSVNLSTNYQCSIPSLLNGSFHTVIFYLRTRMFHRCVSLTFTSIWQVILLSPMSILIIGFGWKYYNKTKTKPSVSSIEVNPTTLWNFVFLFSWFSILMNT